jgi:hypothetical protein
VVTKNRIGNALAVAAAVVGLVLVFSGAGHGDDAGSTPPPASPVQVPAPGQAPQVKAPSSAPAQAPAAPPAKDDDGDG